MGGTTGPRLWRFGDVELDESRAIVRVGGTEQVLDRSGYDVLLALLRHSGEIVTRVELLEAGWPGRVVSENSLSKAISRLRQVLGADGASLRVVHGYGYRLAAAVASTPAQAEDVPARTVREPARPGDPVPGRPGWRIERKLGEGAAGVIFLARSDAGEARAVKFSTSEGGLRSLKREISLSRYLSSLRSGTDGFVPVLGWNLKDQPFFLETPYYADGCLRDWALARGGLDTLPAAQRLDLAAALCDAVADLHAVGIIHRDLKPENIYPVADPLVPGGWRMLLGDLGASDAANTPDLAALGITMSLLDSEAGSDGRHYGSALYIAPEVLAGGMPTQRSDVFSLGVLVYQLATGRLRRTLAPGWEEDVGDALLCEDIALAAAAEPERRNIDAMGLSGRLRALPARRLHRAREEERQAREARQERQAQRERGRRRLLFAVSAALALGLAGTSAMYTRAEGARQEAEREAAQRQAVLDFVTDDILGQADAYRNANADADLSLIDAVDRAAAGVDERLTDPASAAAMHAMVAAVYFAHDRHGDALAQYDRARALYRSLDDRRPGALVAIETGLCDVHRIAGDLASAEEACLSAAAHAKASGRGGDLVTLKLGQLRGEQGRDEESLALLRPLLAADAFAGQPSQRGELRWALGLAERGLGRYDEARRHFEALLALQPADAPATTWSAWAYNSLGSVQVSIGDYDAAEATLVEARRIFGATQGSGQVEAQMPNIWRGEARLRQGRWLEAATLQQSLLDAWRGTLKPNHPLWLKAEANLAWARAEAGQDAPARAALDGALRQRALLFERDGDKVAIRAMRWVRTGLALGADAQVGDLLSIVDAALPREFPPRHPVRAEAECLHARAALALATPAKARARPHAAACAEMLAAFVPRDHPLAREATALVLEAGSGTAVASSARAGD